MSDGRSSFSHSIPFLYGDKVGGYIKIGIGIGIGIGMLYFMLTKIIEKKHMHKMHNTSFSSYQSIYLIKVI